MAGEDLVFNILARDRNAKKTFKDIGDEAEKAAGKIGKFGNVTTLLGGAGPAGAAITGGLLALPAAAGAGAAALGTLALAFRGVKSAIGSGQGADQLEFAGMARSAAEFASESTHLAGALENLQQNVQSEFFKPLVGSFDRLGNAYLPTINRQLPEMAASLGRASRAWTSTLTEASNVGHLNAILQSSNTSVTNLARAGTSLTSVFFKLGDAGGSSTERITTGVAKAAATFDTFVSREQGNGSLARLFDTAASSAESLGRAAAPVASSLYNLFSSSGTAGAAANLFSILGGGTRIVSTLVNAFAALPAPLQSAVLDIGLIAKLSQGTIPAVTGLAGGLASMAKMAVGVGEAGAAAATGLATASSAMVRFAGPIGIAVAALGFLAVAMAGASDQTKPLERDLTKLSDSTRVFLASGQAVGEFAATTGGSLASLASRAHNAADEMAKINNVAAGQKLETYDEFVKNSSKSTAQLQKETEQFITTTRRASNQATEDIKKIASATSDLARSGDIKAAAVLYQQFSDAFRAQGYSVDWVNQQMADYLNVTGGLTVSQYNAVSATKAVSDSQKILNGTWEDAINKLGDLTKAYDVLNGSANEYLESQIAVEEGQDNLAETLGRNKGMWDLDTQGGRDNQSMLLKQIELANKAADAQQKHSLETKGEAEALQDASSVWSTYIQQARESAIANGIATASVDEFIKVHGQMPTGGTVPITTPGAAEATRQVADLDRQIRDLKSKQVQITESGAFNSQQRVAALQAQIDALHNRTIQINTQMFESRNYSSYSDFAENHGRALGGIDLKMGDGGVTSRWLHSPTILAGERGSEAYISMTAPKPRSRQIARQAVDMLGGPDTIWPGRGGGSTSVELHISSGNSALDQVLLEILRNAVRVRGGNVQTVIGR